MMRCGIEFEYLLVDAEGTTTPGRVRDYSNLPYARIAEWLAERPGTDDPALATGDLGIKRGYWYLEGDERFHPDGRFRTLEVKGVEIRTPVRPTVAEAVQFLLKTERQLQARLRPHGLRLAIAGFNPERAHYTFDPPLNPWEQALRQQHRAYDGSQVSTLSFGPDINLCGPGWSAWRSLQAARKLHRCAPYIVPFSFSSPFQAGGLWAGLSRRTWARAPHRPAVKLYLGPQDVSAVQGHSALVHPARLPGESGRLEFKAFDAVLSAPLLQACGDLLVGLCLDRRAEVTRLGDPEDPPDIAIYRRAAVAGWRDEPIRCVAQQLLEHAARALRSHGIDDSALELLQRQLDLRRTPAEDLRAQGLRNGHGYQPGGLTQFSYLPV